MLGTAIFLNQEITPTGTKDMNPLINRGSVPNGGNNTPKKLKITQTTTTRSKTKKAKKNQKGRTISSLLLAQPIATRETDEKSPKNNNPIPLKTSKETVMMDSINKYYP
jgi:hypothetical protein